MFHWRTFCGVATAALVGVKLMAQDHDVTVVLIFLITQQGKFWNKDHKILSELPKKKTFYSILSLKAAVIINLYYQQK